MNHKRKTVLLLVNMRAFHIQGDFEYLKYIFCCFPISLKNQTLTYRKLKPNVKQRVEYIFYVRKRAIFTKNTQWEKENE